MAYEFEQNIFPDFPRTEHLPAFPGYRPNASSDDKVASPHALSLILPPPTHPVGRLDEVTSAWAEDKIDGANSGVMHCPSLERAIGQPFMLRNRNHILRKGFTAKTKGKQQFVPFWNWYYSNVQKFETLNAICGFEACVYGEWLEKTCTIVYDRRKLPDRFVAYDVWDYQNARFVPHANALLAEAGFAVAPILVATITDLAALPPLLAEPSAWAAPAEQQIEPCQVKREGLYIKVRTGTEIVARFKMVRPDYKPGLAFGDNKGNE